MIEFLNNNLLFLFDIHVPVRTVRITKAPALWLTPNLKLMMKLRNKARYKYEKTKTEISLKEYRELRNFLNMAVENEKRSFLHHKFKTDPKSFWRTLKWLNIGKFDYSVSNTDNPGKFNDYFVNSAINSDPILDKYLNIVLILKIFLIFLK